MGIIKLSGKRGEILGGGECTDTIIPSSTPNRTEIRSRGFCQWAQEQTSLSSAG